MCRSALLIIIVLVAGLISSCATTYRIGMPYPSENVSKIEIGKTSEKDIISYFGDPWKTGILNGNVFYTYRYEEFVFHHDDSIENIGNTLMIEFDQNNKVMHYYFNVPGKGPALLSLLMHKTKLIEEEQKRTAWQNQMGSGLVGNN